MSWLLLAGAIVFEVCGTTAMKLSEGFHNILPAVLMIPFYILSFGCLTMAIRKIDVSVAYAIWAGAGTALITVIGIFWFDDAATLLKLLAIGLIIVGVVGLHLQSEEATVSEAAETTAEARKA